ncbi:extracellular solute-binding protein [Paenibacillus eucommiae]|uniref:N-acetylglucosamine transport system substrate-binding protein n=1 Tax=Paenibacillus eucommiae TaxID=1355755 RepID=A0ABS4IP92_9BACL|nr:extracellular solute-binding protein [Paenibacillus eucommiae]MBP1988439.1 N-acetylglucosamine transport system substrate-binding protein [Paenibacillus eucommiae]
MNKKRWVSWSLIMLAFVIALAGCGAKTETKPGAESPKPTTSEQPGTDGGAGTAKLTGDFEVQYFVGGYGDAWWKAIIEEFQQKHPDLKIKQSAGSQINDQMKPRWIQGNPPDFVYIAGAGANPRSMFLDDQLMDLTDWLKEAKNDEGDKILDLLISKPEEYTPGKYFTIPHSFDAWGTFYDKALFKTKGWEAPKDFPSFMALGEKIKAEGSMDVYIHTGVYPYYINGGLLDNTTVSMNNDDGSIITRINALEKGIFKSEPVMKALDRIVQMRDKGFIAKSSVALNHTDSQSQWLQHKAAFIPNGLWIEGEMSKDIPAGFEFGFIPSIGQDPGGKFVAVPLTANVGIAKKAKNPEAAKAFMQFIFTKDASKKWAELSKAIMNVKVDLDDTNAPALIKEANKYLSDPNTIITPETVIPEDLVKVRSDATIALTEGKITPEQWGDRVEEAADKIRAKATK